MQINYTYKIKYSQGATVHEPAPSCQQTLGNYEFLIVGSQAHLGKKFAQKYKPILAHENLCALMHKNYSFSATNLKKVLYKVLKIWWRI